MYTFMIYAVIFVAGVKKNVVVGKTTKTKLKKYGCFDYRSQNFLSFFFSF